MNNRAKYGLPQPYESCTPPYRNHWYSWSWTGNGHGDGWFIEKQCVRCSFIRTPLLSTHNHIIDTTGQRIPDFPASLNFQLARIDYRKLRYEEGARA